MPVPHCLKRSGSALALVVAAGAASLGGCAGVGDGFASSAFVDPARYDLYDCKRLETERKTLTTQAEDKQKLIDKASTGTGGAVIGEMVYRNDYIFSRAQKKLADDAWRRNNCDAVMLPPAPAAPPAATPAAPVKPAAQARQS